MSVEKKGRGRPPKKNIIEENSKNKVMESGNEAVESNNSSVAKVNTESNTVVTSVTNNNNDIPEENINNNDDDLKSFIKETKSKTPYSDTNNSTNNIDDEIDNEIANFEKNEGLNDIPVEEYNPLSDAVKKRGYTDGKMGLEDNVVNNGQQGTLKEQEKVISEPNYSGGGHSKKPDIDATLINPTNNEGQGVLDTEDEFGKYNQQTQTKKPNNNNNNNNNVKSGGDGKSNKSETKEEPIGKDNLKELSPKEKRIATEQTADAILLAYKTYVPLGFSYVASHNISKLKDLDKKDLINLELTNNKGETILDYIKDFNKDVDEAFRITDTEIEMIKPALVDVLMEEEIAFTPKQKLIFVLGQFLVAKIMLLIKFIRQKNADIKGFKQMHLESMEVADEIRKQNEVIRKQNEEILRKMNEKTTETTETTKKSQDNSNLKVVKTDEVNNNKEVSDANIISETKNPVVEEKKPTLEDALNITEENDENQEDKNTDNDIPD